jgi:hypothetical protein
MIAFIAGMPRSGSTFAFNVARDVLRARGHLFAKKLPERLGGASTCGERRSRPPEGPRNGRQRSLPGPLRAMRLICTVRRPEDAVASWMKLLGVSEEQSIDVMRRWLLLYRRIKPFALNLLTFCLAIALLPISLLSGINFPPNYEVGPNFKQRVASVGQTEVHFWIQVPDHRADRSH